MAGDIWVPRLQVHLLRRSVARAAAQVGQHLPKNERIPKEEEAGRRCQTSDGYQQLRRHQVQLQPGDRQATALLRQLRQRVGCHPRSSSLIVR